MEIILVEDEANLRTTLGYAFAREGWSVRDFPDGQAAWDFLGAPGGNTGTDRVVVADISMPRMDGLELCRRVRAIDAELPWLFLSSRDEEFDRVLGLELGADDYLCKPFSVRELVARVKVLHRRASRNLVGSGRSGEATAATEDQPVPAGHALVKAGVLVLDADTWRAWWAGREMVLTVSEFRILASLIAQPGVVKTREQLQLAAYPEDQYINERSVDCHIKRLRRKLEDVGGVSPDNDRAASETSGGGIETVYGIGYRYSA